MLRTASPHSRRNAIAAVSAALIAGLALIASPFAPAQAESASDPENTIILEVGIGYDSPADASPKETGRIVIALAPKFAPKHAARMKELARAGWYNGKVFHRVIEGFMAQTGSPRGDGVGGAEGRKDLPAEFSNVKFERGVVGMARTARPNTANSQFFIMFERVSQLDRNYTVVGHVVSGMNVVDKLTRTHRSTRKGEIPLRVAPDRIISAKVAAD